MKVPYIGKAEYCYSNSTAMMLASIGEDVPPSRIEVLTGMGVGAFKERNSNVIFFDCWHTDKGISEALTSLGFSFDESANEKPDDPPFEELRSALSNGPVVLGPLDIGLLSYRPRNRGANGSVHYILAHGMDDQRVYVHDPWGYPFVSITLEDLREAWEARLIEQKHGYYRHWSNPVRIESPANDDLFSRALATFKKVYADGQTELKRKGHQTGPEAISAVASAARNNGLSDDEVYNLAGFSLPLAAKRALDYSSYFQERNKVVSDAKYEMAQLFGSAQTKLMAKDLNSFSADLEKLADFENRIEGILG